MSGNIVIRNGSRDYNIIADSWANIIRDIQTAYEAGYTVRVEIIKNKYTEEINTQGRKTFITGSSRK